MTVTAYRWCQLIIVSLWVNKRSKDTSGAGRIKTQSPSQTSKGKTDKHILTDNRIIEDEPNKQLFSKQVFAELNELDTQKH